MNSPSWELLSTFLAVLDHGSLSAAARVQRVTQPTARRRIERLETELNGALFTRSQAGLRPTPLGLGLAPHARAMAASAAALVRAASAEADQTAGTVRITASEIMGVEVLPALLRPLLSAHPGLHIELALSNQNQDLLRRDADLAVRMVRPTQQALRAQRLPAIPIGFFAHRSYLAQRGAPTTLDQLRDHALVGQDHGRQLISALASLGLTLRPADFSVRSDSDLAQLAAIRAGLGLGAVQIPLARRSPELVQVLPGLSLPLPLWLVTHEDLRQVRRVRLVFDHLVETLRSFYDEPGSTDPSGE